MSLMKREVCTGGLEKMGLEKMGQGWKKWDKVEKNGTTFLLRNYVEKWDNFFSLIIPNKLVHLIRQGKILTGQAAIRIISARRGRKLCHIMWCQFSYTKPEVLSVSLSLSYNVYPE